MGDLNVEVVVPKASALKYRSIKAKTN